MKKLLALVLALVMTLGLATVSSNAAFSDADSINYDEAVDVMAGLQILEGYDTGDFKPATVLNREQAAKIVAYMQLGKKTADALNVKSSFTDTQGNWAESYIAYCVSQGIIAGVGDNKFNPKGELTGYAFAKMVLCALGYDAEYEGLVGDGWEIKVAKLVNSIDLNDDMTDVALSDGMSREQASQMAFNALFLPTKNFNKGTQITGTNLSVSTGGTYGNNGASLYATVFEGKGGEAAYGFVTANASNSKDALKNGTTTITKIAGGTLTVNLETGADLFGKYVAVYYKDAYTSASKPGTAYAIIDKTVETKVSKDDKAAALKTALSEDGYDVDGNVVFTREFKNGAVTNTEAKKISVTPGTTSGATTKTVTLYGWYDSTNKVTQPYGYAVADTYTVEKVKAISTVSGKETITLNTAGVKNNNATEDIVNEYDGIAKDDIVLCYANGEIFNLVKPEIVTGKASAVSTKASSLSVTINGVKYAFSGATNNSGETARAANEIGFTDEYKVYVDANGDAAMVTGIAAAKDLVYVVATYDTTATGTYGNDDPKHFIQGVDASGVEVNYQVYFNNPQEYVTSKKASYTAGDKIATSTLYEVSTAYDSDAKATMATLTAIANNGDTKGAVKDSVNALKTNSATAATKYYLSNSTKFIFVKDSKADLKVTVLDGRQAVAAGTTWTAYGTKAATATNYDVQYVFVTGEAAVETSSIAFAAESSNSTALVPYTDANGNTQNAYQHTVYVDGEKTTILMAGASAVSGFLKLTTSETTGLTTAADYSNTDSQKSVVGAKADALYNGYLTTNNTTPGTFVKAGGSVATQLVNALVSDSTKIVDLTDNDISTASQLATLIDTDSHVIVTLAFVYDDTKTNDDLAIIYVTDVTFAATVAKGANADAGKMVASYDVSDDSIAADGVSYEWKVSDAQNGTFTTIPDASTAKIDGTANKWYKVTITITTTDGYTIEATSTAVQNA